MKKLLSGSYYIVLLLGVLFVVGSFLFAKNETHFRKGEIAGHQQITPQSITQVDEMTKEYVFSGEQFTIYALLFILSILALKCMKMAS